MTSLHFCGRLSNALAATILGSLLVSCGGGGSSSSSANSPPPAANVAQIVVNGGPPAASGNINLPFVSVTICTPGTSDCQTIDQVLVDTGSYGLRIIGPGVISSSLRLPSVTGVTGKPLAECAQFVSGFTWGSVSVADVKIAGQIAPSAPIEIIGNPDSAFSSIPQACSDAGANIGTIAELGANGILGVGLFKEDCGPACAASTSPGFYYECSAGTCSGTLVPLEKQVTNPVALFSRDNNGVVVELPSVPLGGASSITGKLIFGIGTQENNQIAGKTIYRADGLGNFKTTYKGTTYQSSFIDTGSNGIFFPDESIPVCALSSGFYCPASPLTLNAVNAAYDDSASGNVAFTIENVDLLASEVAVASVGGTASSFDGIGGFDWGLPFFFGRTVFVAIENINTPSGPGPFWAY